MRVTSSGVQIRGGFAVCGSPVVQIRGGFAVYVLSACRLPPPQIHRSLHRLLLEYKDARRGPTVVFLQSPLTPHVMAQGVPALEEFPNVHIPALER